MSLLQYELKPLSRPCSAEIDLAALKHNLGVIRRRTSSGVRIMAVVKSDAYGHGLETVSLALEANGVECFGVVEMDEAIALRQAGITKPVLLMAGAHGALVRELVGHGLTAGVISTEMLLDLEKAALAAGVSLEAHLKLDSGMNRLGIPTDEISTLLKLLPGLRGVQLTGVYSHLANSDHHQDPFAFEQFHRFQQAVLQIEQQLGRPLVKHIANSGAIFRESGLHADLVRPGIALYGLGGSSEMQRELRPVMALKSALIQIKRVRRGESIGYDRHFVASRDTLMGVLPVGYADGYSRAYQGAQVALDAGMVPVAGRICMDMLMVDLTDLRPAQALKVGDVVTLFGALPGPSAYDLARLSGTTHYQVLTSIHSRVKRIYK